jgi:hypothetical protein
MIAQNHPSCPSSSFIIIHHSGINLLCLDLGRPLVSIATASQICQHIATGEGKQYQPSCTRHPPRLRAGKKLGPQAARCLSSLQEQSVPYPAICRARQEEKRNIQLEEEKKRGRDWIGCLPTSSCVTTTSSHINAQLLSRQAPHLHV